MIMNSLKHAPRGLVLATFLIVLGASFHERCNAGSPGPFAPDQGKVVSEITRGGVRAERSLRFSRARDLFVTIKFEASQQGKDGVLRSTVFEEEMVRQGQSVWTRRKSFVPAAETHSASGSHKHLNLIEAIRWVSKTDAVTSLQFLARADRALVFVPEVEYANVGFDGSWARAYYLVDPSDLALYQEVQRPAIAMPLAGKTREGQAKWFERRSSALLERVLWDFDRGIALIIESESLDGRRKFRATVTPQNASPKTQLWIDSAQFEQRRYSDYLD
jgi:hypothetical protein